MLRVKRGSLEQHASEWEDRGLRWEALWNDTCVRLQEPDGAIDGFERVVGLSSYEVSIKADEVRLASRFGSVRESQGGAGRVSGLTL